MSNNVEESMLPHVQSDGGKPKPEDNKRKRKRRNKSQILKEKQRKCHYKIPLPCLGQPGGLDDPRRGGLNNSECARYLYFLSEGHEPKKARRKAVVRTRSISTSDNRKGDNYYPDNIVVTRPLTNGENTVEKGANSRVTQRRKQISIHNISIPNLGQPGGLDDPLREGLNESECAWYLFFLAQNYRPVNARRKALERKVELNSYTCGTQKVDSLSPPEIDVERVNIVSTKFDAVNARKEALEQKVEQHPYTCDKKKVDGSSSFEIDAESIQIAPTKFDAVEPVGSHGSSAKAIKVGVYAFGYPDKLLTREQLNELEEVMGEEMMENSNLRLNFHGIKFLPGLIIVDCCDQNSADWVLTKAPTLKKWLQQPKLCASYEKDIPSAYKITVALPRSSKMGIQDLMILISQQNREFNTKSWKILRSHIDGDGVVLQIGIDEQTRRAIVYNNNFMFFRFGKIPIRGLEMHLPSPAFYKPEETKSCDSTLRSLEEAKSIVPI